MRSWGIPPPGGRVLQREDQPPSNQKKDELPVFLNHASSFAMVGGEDTHSEGILGRKKNISKKKQMIIGK